MTQKWLASRHILIRSESYLQRPLSSSRRSHTNTMNYARVDRDLCRRASPPPLSCLTTHPNPLAVEVPVATIQPRLMQVIQAVTKSTCPQTVPVMVMLPSVTVASRRPRSLAGASLRPRSVTCCPKAAASRRGSNRVLTCVISNGRSNVPEGKQV